MWIINQERTAIFNANTGITIFVKIKQEGYVVFARNPRDENLKFLGRYQHLNEAQNVMDDMFASFKRLDEGFMMPQREEEP